MGILSKLKENKELKNNKLLELNNITNSFGNKIRTARVTYLGGYIDFSPGIPFHGTIEIYEKGIIYKPTTTSHKFVGFTVPLESIDTAAAKNERDVEKDVTLTRLLLLGIYAFGLKKKKIEKHDYLILDCNINNAESKIVFEINNINSSVLVADIMKLKR